MRLLGVLLVLVGCHGAGSVTPDASTEPDAPPRSQGLTVTWRARPNLPGMVSDKIMVTEAVFQLEHLQLVGDASSDHTTHAQLQLQWDDQGGPPDEKFPDAPAAHYQQILHDMRSDFRPPYSFAYRIQGVWQDDQNSRPFQIVDPTILEVPVACDVMLPAGGAVTVAIRLDLGDALERVDFKNLDPKDGVLVPSIGQLAGLRDELIHHAFVIDN